MMRMCDVCDVTCHSCENWEMLECGGGGGSQSCTSLVFKLCVWPFLIYDERVKSDSTCPLWWRRPGSRSMLTPLRVRKHSRPLSMLPLLSFCHFYSALNARPWNGVTQIFGILFSPSFLFGNALTLDLTHGQIIS